MLLVVHIRDGIMWYVLLFLPDFSAPISTVIICIPQNWTLEFQSSDERESVRQLQLISLSLHIQMILSPPPNQN